MQAMSNAKLNKKNFNDSKKDPLLEISPSDKNNYETKTGSVGRT